MIQTLNAIKTMFAAANVEDFEDFGEKDRQLIFDLVGSIAVSSDSDGDKDGISATFDLGFAQIDFFGYGEYIGLDYVRSTVNGMQISADQKSLPTSAEGIDRLIALADTPINVVNLTPHEIVIVDDERNVTARFPASGQTARVNSRSVDLQPVAGVPAVRTEYGSIDDLPRPQPGTVYLVSIVVAQALREPRQDVYVPDTGPASVVRDDDGKIFGVRRLMQL